MTTETPPQTHKCPTCGHYSVVWEPDTGLLNCLNTGCQFMRRPLDEYDLAAWCALRRAPRRWSTT